MPHTFPSFAVCSFWLEGLLVKSGHAGQSPFVSVTPIAEYFAPRSSFPSYSIFIYPDYLQSLAVSHFAIPSFGMKGFHS